MARMLPAFALLAGSARPLEPIQPRQCEDRRSYDARVALQHRIERRVRKATSYRRQHKLAPVTEVEIRSWVEEEAKKLGLQLKEEDHGSDEASAPDEQG